MAIEPPDIEQDWQCARDCPPGALAIEQAARAEVATSVDYISLAYLGWCQLKAWRVENCDGSYGSYGRHCEKIVCGALNRTIVKVQGWDIQEPDPQNRPSGV